jgi:CRISPR-associated protein Cmr6
MMCSYYIPKSTIEVLRENMISNNVFSNLSLFYHKYPRYDHSLKKFIFPEKWEFKSERKCLSYSAIIYNYTHKFIIDKVELCVKTDWRMVIGLGSESVYETSMTLHHIYGFPYIPGQAIKGLIRNYVINEYFLQDFIEWKKENPKTDIDNFAEQDESFVFIFGSQEKQGKVVFFDALPVTEPIIEPDVMTPHFGDYYSDSKNEVPPADYISPNPIKFLTVKDTSFVFIMGKKNINQEQIPQSGKLADKLQNGKLLDSMEVIAFKALSEYGIGAKSAVGYGYLTDKRKELPQEFLNEVNKLKPEAEINEEKKMELMNQIDQDFSLYKFKELIKETEGEEGSRDVILLNQIFNILIKKENYESLAKNNQHHDLVNYGFEFRELLARASFHDMLAKFNVSFNKIIKDFGSKNKKKEWHKIIKGE